MSKIIVPDEIKQLATALKESLTIDPNGVASLPANHWETLLPEGVTAKQVKAIDKAVVDFTAAQALAVGEMAVERFKSDKDLKSVSISTDFGSGLNRRVIEQTVLRDKDIRNVQTGAVTTAHGYIGSKVVQRGNGGLKQVKEHIRAIGMEAIG